MAELVFEDGFCGTYTIGEQTLAIGYDAIRPYDMTFGALAACLYSTFTELAKEAGITLKRGVVQAEGRKRRTVPSTLEYVKLRVHVEADAERHELKRIFDDALEKCSMAATIRMVAELDASLV